jgi:cytoskeletal protein RodZ
MLIAILVLLGLAGAIWYFASKQTQTVTLSQEDIAASTPSFDETEAKLKEAQLAALKIDKKLDKMTKKIDEALAAVPAPEVTTPKVEVVEEKAPVVEAAPVAPVVESAPVVEAPKPAKKKRRYYPKKK